MSGGTLYLQLRSNGRDGAGCGRVCDSARVCSVAKPRWDAHAWTRVYTCPAVRLLEIQLEEPHGVNPAVADVDPDAVPL